VEIKYIMTKKHQERAYHKKWMILDIFNTILQIAYQNNNMYCTKKPMAKRCEHAKQREERARRNAQTISRRTNQRGDRLQEAVLTPTPGSRGEERTTATASSPLTLKEIHAREEANFQKTCLQTLNFSLFTF
jgi:hypothetical protein